MSTVTPIRPGLQWEGREQDVHRLPAGIELLKVTDNREGQTCRGILRLSFDVAGDADSLVAAGITTHELINAIPKSRKKTVTTDTAIQVLKRRKGRYVVHTCLYRDDNPDVPRFAAMLGLNRPRVRNPSAPPKLSQGGIRLAEQWEQLPPRGRAAVEGLVMELLRK